MSVLLAKIPSPLNPEISIKIDLEFVPGKNLDHYINGQIPSDFDDITWVVSKNGLIVTDPYPGVAINDGDKIAVCPRQEGTIAGIVAGTIAGAAAGTGVAVGSFSTALYLGAGTAFVYGATYIATMFVIGYGMSMLASALAPSMDSGSDYDSDTTYGWGVLSQTSNEGVYIPRYYGTNKVAGHTINQFVKISEDEEEETLYVLNALCDHQLDSISDILVNENPAEYYKECTTYTQLGTLSDDLIPGFSELVTQNDIGSEITEDTPITYQTKGECEKIDLILSAPSGFYYTSDDGDLETRKATYTIKYKVTGEENWNVFVTDEEWSGKTTSGIKKVVTLDNLPLNNYDIYLIRTNSVIESYKGRNNIRLSSVQEILKEELTYPGLAKYALKVLATDQLSSSIPALTCITSLDSVQVYDENNSAWMAKSAKNPAWICYDILIQHKVPVSRIIFDEFYEWAEFCDTNVAETGDPEEKRIEINTVIQGGNVWEQVQKIAKMGRAVIIRRNTKYGVFIDKQDDTVSHLFTMGNIVEGSFSMQYLPQRDRATAVEIEYSDPDRNYTRQIVTVFSDDYINETSTQQQKATVAFDASFSQAQAIREGVYRLNSNRFLVRVVTFDAFLDSFACVVGDIFEFQHESVNYIASDIGGVVKDAGNGEFGTNPYITLDKPVYLEASYVYKIKVRLSDDTLVEKTIDTNSISDFSEPFQTLPVTIVWESVPSTSDIYAFGQADTYIKKYRITSVTKKDELTRSIIGLEYIEEIYTANDDYIIEEQTWEDRKQEAIQVMADEFLAYSADASYVSNVNVTWHRAYSLVSNTWGIWLEDQTAGTAAQKVGTSNTCQYTITSGLTVGNTYKIYVTLDGQGLIDTGQNTTTITIQGKLAPPDDITEFSASYNVSTRAVNFTWSPVSNLDLSRYEIRLVNTVVASPAEYTPTDGTTIAFVDGGGGADTITDSVNGFLAAGFEAGDEFTVSGSTSNDGDYTIVSVTAGTITLNTGAITTAEPGVAGVAFAEKTTAVEDPVTYTPTDGTTISFVDGGEGADTITDSAGGFITAGFEASDTFTVSGSTSNDGEYTIVSVTANTITLSTGTITTAEPGIAGIVFTEQVPGAESRWINGTKVISTIDNAASIYISESMDVTATYSIKAIDTSGIESENANECNAFINTGANTDVSVPDSLTLTSTISTNEETGVSVANLQAAWGVNAETLDAFSHYKVLLLDVEANQSAEWTTTENQYSWTASVATSYGCAVCSVDEDGKSSDYCEMVYHTTEGDATPPSAPTFDTELNIVPGFKVMGLTWNTNTEYDMDHYVVQRSTSESFSSDVVNLGEFKVTFFTDTLSEAFNLDSEGNYESSIVYYYRIAAVDTSGNQSEWSEPVSGASLQTGTEDIAYNAVFANHIFGDQIEARHINSSEIFTMTIQSENYVEGTDGWIIDQHGHIELNGGSLTISDAISSITEASAATGIYCWEDELNIDGYTSSNPYTKTFESEAEGQFFVDAYFNKANSSDIDTSKIHILINDVEIAYRNT